MWRNDCQVALSEVMVACKQAADRYREAADLAEESGLSLALGELAERREGQGLGLESHVRALGDLPREPDADRQAIDGLVSRLRTQFAPSPRQEIRDEVLHLERDLSEKIDAALAVEGLPAPVRVALRALREDVAATLERVDRMASADDHSA